MDESHDVVIVGAGPRFEDKQLARTLEVWRLRCCTLLTDEEAREIADNTIGFFRVPIEWKSAKVQADSSGSP